MISEWSQKCEELQLELDSSQKECRIHMTESYKLKTAYEEAQDHLESVKKDNKTLAGKQYIQNTPFLCVPNVHTQYFNLHADCTILGRTTDTK